MFTMKGCFKSLAIREMQTVARKSWQVMVLRGTLRWWILPPACRNIGNTGIHAELVGVSTCTTALTDSLNKLRMCKPYLNVKKSDHPSPLGDMGKGVHCSITRDSGRLEEAALSPWGRE